MWQGYIERRNMHEVHGRKRDGATERLTQPGEVELNSPDTVAEWIGRTVAELSKDADQWAQVKNGLMVRPANVYAATARKGASVYATVQASRTEVWDVCAEAVP